MKVTRELLDRLRTSGFSMVAPVREIKAMHALCSAVLDARDALEWHADTNERWDRSDDALARAASIRRILSLLAATELREESKP